MKRIIPLVCTLLTGTLLPDAPAADWPQFRGPTGDGIASAASNPPLAWNEKINIGWRTELPGPGSSSPVVSGQRIFLTCYSGYGVDKANPGDITQLQRHAVCLDRTTGKILWSDTVTAPAPDKPYQGEYITMHGYASSTPVTDGQSVFFSFGNAGVVAYSIDGRKLWQAEVGLRAHDWGAGTSPILYGDLVIVNAAIESDSLIALDKRTGKTVWSVRGFPNSWNTPKLVKLPTGSEELVVSSNNKIRAFDPKTGQELWFCKGIPAAELCPSVVAHDGVIYVIGRPGGQALAVRAGGKGDVTETHILWRAAKGSNVGSPVYHDGHLYFVNDARGIALCLKAETGEVVYEQPISPQRDRWYASPVLAQGRLYYVSRTTGTVILAAKPQLEVLATNFIADDPSVFNGSPAIVDNQIFLRSNKYAYCIQGNKPVPPRPQQQTRQRPGQQRRSFEARSNFDPSTLVPFTAGTPYLSKYETGLYPGAKNEMPLAHREAGRQIAATIQPLDTEGQPDSSNGRIVGLVLGHSNCSMYFRAFEQQLKERQAELHPRFELVNAAVGGQQLPEISQLEKGVWNNARRWLSRPGYSDKQVQVLFLHTTYHRAGNSQRMPAQFPERMQQMRGDLEKVLAHCVERFPNLKIAFLTSDGFRHFTGFEPHVWQESFGIKWMIESQLKREPGTEYAGPNRRLPWLAWGPYIWDNAWDRSYFTDGVHPAPKAQAIFVSKYWDFLSREPVATPWFSRRRF